MLRIKERARYWIQRPALRCVLRRDSPTAGVLMADTIIPEGVLRPGDICYCGGVGEDIRLEEQLIKQFGVQVWAFDPTPRAVRFIEARRPLPDEFHFVPEGLWSEDATLRFYSPANPSHVSHSVEGPLGGDSHFDALCRSVSSLMQELGHAEIDLLKMNIEGAEDKVLGSALEAGSRPKVIALTFEGRGAFRKAVRWTRRLRQEGYQLAGVHGWWVTYLRDRP